MKRSDFRFLERLRVRWAEVDMQKIVFNGHYLLYIDTAVAGYWRALALPYHETMEQLQGDLYVRKATLEYLGSARYDEQIDVGVRCQRIGNSSMAFVAAVFRGESVLVHGELVYVFADPSTQTARPVPEALRKWLMDHEAGQPMTELRTGSWRDLGDASRSLREAVFVGELAAPTAIVADSADEHAHHAVLFNRASMPVASGRLVTMAQGVGQIGRMATTGALRGSGLGRQVLGGLLVRARALELREVFLYAAVGAMPFYARAGFVEQGERFEEAGLPHVRMSLRL